MRKVAAITVIAAFALAGCSTSGTGNDSTYPDTYRSVEELRDAFVAAGGECPNWEQSNRVAAAAESGTCSATNVLSIYSSESSKDQMVETLKSISDNVTLLVGTNWVINDPSVRDLDPALGGTLVTK